MPLRSTALAAALVWGCAWATTYRFESLPEGMTQGDFVYRFVGQGRVKDFVLEAAATTTSAGPALRVLFACQDERNYYYAQAADTGCGFVKVEDGVEQRIGTPSEGLLPRGAAVQIALIRWRHRMGLWLDGRQVAEAYDDTFRMGRVGLAGRSDSATVGTVRFQAVADIRMSDDFMRTGAEQTAWESVAGDWKLKSLPSASLSANAFMFEAKAAEASKPALAVRGHWFWHDYAASVACRPASEEAVGLVFYYRGPTQYYLVRWESALGQSRRLQLLRVAGEERTVLGEAAVGFVRGQWYQLGVRVLGRRVAAEVDGNPLINVTDPRLVSGSVGLYTEGEALFDDVVVAEPRGFEEDFGREAAGKWLELGGRWQWLKGTLDGRPDGGHCLIGSASEAARYISGEDAWSDYTVAADVLPPVKGEVGLVACYQDEADYYLFSLSPKEATLTKVLEGQRTELARTPCELPLGAVHRLELSVLRGVLTGRLDGRALVQRCDLALTHGRAGLAVSGSAGSGFDNVAVTFPERPQPLFTTHSVFAAEASMENWSVRQSDWLAVDQAIAGAARTVQWHRADFPGDVELQAKLGDFPEGARLWLALASDGKDMASGCRVALERGKQGCTVAIERGGKPVAQREFPKLASPGLFSAERVGGAILAHLDGKVALTFDDPGPLGGPRIGWAAAGTKVDLDTVEIFSRCVTAYAFNQAPVDWRAAGGEWEVANRWACDPRWSFFAGERRGGDPLVALWNKRDFGPDLALEFAAGIRHDPDRGGTAYSYASDINAVVCGDGADLRNGYNFVFGGWNNQHTRILRDGKTLADTTAVRFPGDSSQHRRWFYFKIQKQGSHLRFFVDNALALECTDPQPLTGRRVALWTWNNDIMVARVRVSAPGAAPCEPPAPPPPAKPECCYR